ncbi:MAG: hypothetical protein HY881_05520 [Deltaproteobacteria bacterium]|nr:hypothetical protein [Deltaproteobacteria bacterium]
MMCYVFIFHLVLGILNAASMVLILDASGSMVFPPAPAAVNTEVELLWQGPGYKSNYISIARQDQQPGGNSSV